MIFERSMLKVKTIEKCYIRIIILFLILRCLIYYSIVNMLSLYDIFVNELIVVY